MGASILLILLAATPREDFDQAVQAYRSGLYGPTLYAMEQLLLEPGFEAADSALLLAGQSAFHLSRYEKALRYLERHLADAPDPAPAALENVLISALELGKPGKAYQLFSAYPRFEVSQHTKLRLAEALEEEEAYQEAREVYLNIDDADLRLVGAKMLINAGRFDLLGSYLEDLRQTYPQVAEVISALQIEATLTRGDSLASLEAGLGMGEPQEIQPAQAVVLGRLFAAFNLYEDAVAFYSSAADKRRYDVLLELAATYAALGRNREAVKTYQDAQDKLTFSAEDEATQARVRLLSGKDFDTEALLDADFLSWNTYQQALDLLAEQGEDELYGELLMGLHFQRPPDILRKARLLEEQGNYRQALAAYQEYLEKAPFAAERDEAAKEADLIRHFHLKDAEAALKKLVAAENSSQKGKILFEDAKDYHGAIAFLDTVSTPQAFYYSGLSYERLYLKEGKVRVLDKARERYQNLYWQFPESRLVEDALYRLFITELRDPVKRMEQGLSYLDNFPQGEHADQVRFLLGFLQLSRGDTTAARSEWENLYLTRPQSPYNYPVLYQLAELSAALGDSTDAQAKLSLILSVAPHDTLYYLASKKLAELYQGRDKNLQALGLYANMAEGLAYLPPDLWEQSVELMFTLRQYQRLEDFAHAFRDAELSQEVVFYTRAAKVQAEVADTADVKALFHVRPAGRGEEFLYWTGIGAGQVSYPGLGRHILKRLAREGTDSALVSKARFLLAQYEIAGGEDSSAVARLESLHAADPEDTLVLSKLVVALYRTGRLEKADSLWLELDLADPADRSPLLLEKVAYLLDEGRIEEADSVLSSLSEVRKLWENENFLYYKGLVAAKQGRNQEALQLYQSFIEKFSQSDLTEAVNFKLGTLYYMAQELDSSAYYYRRSLSSPQLRQSALGNLATIARKRSDFDQALDYFEQLAREVTSPQERGEVYLEMGITAYQGMKYSRAITYFERALPLVTEERPRLLYWTARAHAAFADPAHLQRAVSLFLQCHQEFPQDQWGLECWLLAGQGYLQLERPEDARVIFQAILSERGEQDPFGARAKNALDEMN